MIIKRLDRDKAVYMLIDVQERLLPVMAEKEEVMRNNRILLQGTELLGVKRLISEQYPRGLGKTIEELAEHFSEEELHEKMSFSLMDDLREEILQLIDQGKTQFVIGGIEAHVCVYQTARDLLAMGMQVVIASDAVSSRQQSHKEAALANLRSLGADVLPTETILFDLQRYSGVENFKEISNLVK